MSFNQLLAFTKKVADFADQVTGNPADIKAQFDAAPEELRTYFNNLVDALKSTATGDSGAKNTGATAITGLTGTDVQTLLENLNAKFTQTVTWITPTTLNGWVFYGDVGSSAAPQGYRKDISGNVWVKGIIKSGTNTNGTVLFNLPSGYRPKEIRYFGGFDGAGVFQRLEIDPNGDVKIAAGSGSINNAFLTLDLIAFPAEQ